MRSSVFCAGVALCFAAAAAVAAPPTPQQLSADAPTAQQNPKAKRAGKKPPKKPAPPPKAKRPGKKPPKKPAPPPKAKRPGKKPPKKPAPPPKAKRPGKKPPKKPPPPPKATLPGKKRRLRRCSRFPLRRHLPPRDLSPSRPQPTSWRSARPPRRGSTADWT